MCFICSRTLNLRKVKNLIPTIKMYICKEGYGCCKKVR